jgi:hypothetical protein
MVFLKTLVLKLRNSIINKIIGILIMIRSDELYKKILEFREKKVKELKKNISFSEAIALWLSEARSNGNSDNKIAPIL